MKNRVSLPVSIHGTQKERQSINTNGVISSEELDWIVASIVVRTIESERLVPESHSFLYTERTVVLEKRKVNKNLQANE